MIGISHRLADTKARKLSTAKRVERNRPKQGAEPPNACDILEETALISTNRTALALVHVGETLQIEYRPGPPPLVVAMTKAGTAAGALNSSLSVTVADCIHLGVSYVVKVLSVEKQRCIVLLRRRRY
jgi:hypothetical protein